MFLVSRGKFFPSIPSPILLGGILLLIGLARGKEEIDPTQHTQPTPELPRGLVGAIRTGRRIQMFPFGLSGNLEERGEKIETGFFA